MTAAPETRILTAREAARLLAQLKEPYHFVAIDCETTGKRHTDRVIALALLTWNAGKVWSGWSTLVNPGLTRIGATHVHHLEASDLRGAPSFAGIIDDVLRHLTPPPGKTTVLVGHVVAFDIGRLRYELGLEDTTLPDGLLTLDTAALARAAGVAPKGRRLEHLLDALKLANPAPHQATGDALAAGQAAAALLEQLAQDGRDTIADLLVPASAVRVTQGSDTPVVELDPEHQAVHDQALVGSSAARITSLRYCLDHDCPRFPERVEDAITGQARARDLADWCADLLADTTLSRQQAGLAAGGLGRALRRLHVSPAQAEARYRAARPAITSWGPCSDPDDRCDRCAAERTCRFVRVQQRFVNAALYSDKDRITLERAAAFLPVPAPPSGRRKDKAIGPARSGPKPRGWYGRLRKQGDHAAAAHGAVLAARRRRDGLRLEWSLATLRCAWDDGLRTPSLAYTYSTVLEQTYRRDVDAHLVELYDICDAVVAAGPGADRYGWRRLVARHTRLKQRIDATTAPSRTTGKVSANCHDNQPLGPRNRREARPNPFAVIRT